MRKQMNKEEKLKKVKTTKKIYNIRRLAISLGIKGAKVKLDE